MTSVSMVGDRASRAPTLPEAVQVAHDRAVSRGEHGYRDPVTGQFVFTSLGLRARGDCCGSGCRHCPYDHVNVPARR